MKLKIYVIKKQYLITAIALIVVAIIAIIVFLSIQSIRVFNDFDSTKTFQEDINNDGRKDTIVLNADQNTAEYTMQVISNDGTGYSIEADPVIKTLGYYNKNWPLNLLTTDIDNDGSSEIVVQASDEKGAILHIYKYKNGSIERLASGRYSIFGTLKNPNNNSKLVLLGNINTNKISLSYLTFKDGSLVPAIVPKSFSLGKNSLSNFVSSMEKKEIETSSMNIDSQYSKDLKKGVFLDCNLIDAKYFKNYDIPSECTYVLRAKSNNLEGEKLVKYKLELDLTKYDPSTPVYKIMNIDEL